MPLPRALVVWLALSAVPSFAAGEAIGLLRVDPPAGWTRSANDSSVAFERIDQAKGTFCRVTVGLPVPSMGSAAADFEAEWRDWVSASMTVRAPPRPTTGQTSGRVAFVEGRADLVNAGTPFHYELFAFTSGGQRASVQVIAGAAAQVDACRTGPLKAFFASLQLTSGAAAAQPVTVTAAPPAPVDVGSWSGPAPRGVYMAHVFAPLSGSYAPSPRWLVLYADGSSYAHLPQHGLGAFDRAKSQADGDFNWGRWTWSGGAGKNVNTSNPRNVTTLKQDGAILVVDSDRYSRLVSVDGLRLDGAWTSYANPADPALSQQPIGQRPLIRFTRAGRFADEGLLRQVAIPNEIAVGSGAYSVKDFTVTLRYDDGRVDSWALHGFLSIDPARDDARIVLGRMTLQKTRQ